MIGIGIDSVEIERFEHWHQFQRNTLKKIFSEQEIEYCLSNPIKSAERFAARFAAREACFKALSGRIDNISFLAFCKLIRLDKNDQGKPKLIVDWLGLCLLLPVQSHVSITHTKTTATCLVVLMR